MRIADVEISNFRKLLSVRIELSEQTTLFVGANNSGKTSAMVALRLFLARSQRVWFSTNDFTLAHWKTINAIGANWEGQPDPPGLKQWLSVLPTIDVWLHVEKDELHHVSRVIPTLDWCAGLLGIRLRLQPKNVEALFKDYVKHRSRLAATKATVKTGEIPLRLWPDDMIAFLERHLRNHFEIRSFPLDPSARKPPENGKARPQELPADLEPLEGNPLDGLIRVDEIGAQRDLSQETAGEEEKTRADGRKLSAQLQRYYKDHLNPDIGSPDPEDLPALLAIEKAEEAFDSRLDVSFKDALEEVQGLGYPGVTDPIVKISTQLRPIEGLNHSSAVQYEIECATAEGPTAPIAQGRVLRLPEHLNGLGYQNLLSMIFRLMSFRDAWMLVGKKEKILAEETTARIEPLHLVLVEEPEAHLHVQVQQVFIKKAYDVLRKHKDLGDNNRLRTQLVVSTHSSHVAHEVDYDRLRYFRRLQAGMGGCHVPVSTVVNLSNVFGQEEETKRFVTRYLRASHCELFFADAAIFVEGSAERMLLPHFLRRKEFEYLSHSYISLLEIGGSHAHRLKSLIEHLSLTTLIITDLDAARSGSRVVESPRRGTGQNTNNPTLTKWLPKLGPIDQLLDAGPDQKEEPHDALFSVRVAYQCPITVPLNGTNVEMIANTFEDSLVLENLDYFGALKGSGLVDRFRNAIASCREPPALAEALSKALADGDKAEFALDVLCADGFDDIRLPSYIHDGLRWLEKRLAARGISGSDHAAA